MGRLVLHLPDGSTREIRLKRERMTIGRRPDNDICVPLPTVSGEHAAVVTVHDDSFLEDLQSRNGTLVNGKEVRKHLLRDRDEIDIGRQRLVYFSGESASDDEAVALADPAGRDQVATAPAHLVSAAAALGSDAFPVARFVSDGGAAPDAAARPDGPADRATIDTSTLFDEIAEADERHRPTAADAPSLEVLDGPSAGTVARLARDEFVVGRIGMQVAAVRCTPDGYRLVHVEGDVPPKLNGAELPREGALLALGDEIVIAGTRLRYRPVG